MPAKHEKTLRQLIGRAQRYAAFCFDPAEQQRWRASAGRADSISYAVVVSNRFVPLDAIPGIAPILRRYARRSASLSEEDMLLLKAYWDAIDEALKKLDRLLTRGEAISTVQALARTLPTWPAIDVVDSDEAMRSLLGMQFERIRQHRISWDSADGSTYPVPTRNGMYLLIDWAQRG